MHSRHKMDVFYGVLFIVLVVMAAILGWGLNLPKANSQRQAPEAADVTAVVGKITPGNSDALYQSCVEKIADPTHLATSDFSREGPYYQAINGLCYQRVQSMLLLRDFEFRRQQFNNAQLDNQQLNRVAMVILLFATFSGIVLAGLQLLSSYRLMSQGYAKIGTDSDVVVKYNSVAIKSSIAGVTIFAISMLFFAVYIRFTYQTQPSELRELPLLNILPPDPTAPSQSPR
jgi:hypothetical protein